MGLFKQMKDLKSMVSAAPDLMEQAQQLGAQAQEMAAAQRAAAVAAQAGASQRLAAEGPDFEPIAGVSLRQYAEISKEVNMGGYDQARAVQVAASRGVPAENWHAALEGWNGRMKMNPAVSQQFSALYSGS